MVIFIFIAVTVVGENSKYEGEREPLPHGDGGAERGGRQHRRCSLTGSCRIRPHCGVVAGAGAAEGQDGRARGDWGKAHGTTARRAARKGEVAPGAALKGRGAAHFPPGPAAGGAANCGEQTVRPHARAGCPPPPPPIRFAAAQEACSRTLTAPPHGGQVPSGCSTAQLDAEECDMHQISELQLQLMGFTPSQGWMQEGQDGGSSPSASALRACICLSPPAPPPVAPAPSASCSFACSSRHFQRRSLNSFASLNTLNSSASTSAQRAVPKACCVLSVS